MSRKCLLGRAESDRQKNFFLGKKGSCVGLFLRNKRNVKRLSNSLNQEKQNNKKKNKSFFAF